MTRSLTSALPPKGRNAILETLLGVAPRLLKGYLVETELEADQVLFTEEEGVDGLYFPITSVVCRLVTLPEGTTVKVSLAGREGVVGTPALVGGTWSAFLTTAQLAGEALFLGATQSRELLAVPAAREILFRYLLLLLREASLTAACNRAHAATPRLARWLLLVRDRAEQDAFPVTHDSLAKMLGVRRERVSLSAQQLRSLGAIQYRRGTMTIVDPGILESEACSCYATLADLYVAFLEREARPRDDGRSRHG
jgi:CRP-like cAMP-binding protein